jgi:hypothetical protein
LSELKAFTYVDPTDVDGHVRGVIAGVNYVYIARFWFAVGSLFAMTLFVVSFRKSFSDSHPDPRHRSFLWLWMAVAAIAGPSYAVTHFLRSPNNMISC